MAVSVAALRYFSLGLAPQIEAIKRENFAAFRACQSVLN